MSSVLSSRASAKSLTSRSPPGKGCGFVQFVQRHAAEMAINQMQGYPIGNSRVRLSWGRSQNNSGPAGSPYRPAPPPPPHVPLHGHAPGSPVWRVCPDEVSVPLIESTSRSCLRHSNDGFPCYHNKFAIFSLVPTEVLSICSYSS
ncbi:uncharacterized protein N7469_005172 [Penicillium citrinum]|uniref:RRM domain-containing protein n=1 Tax=Penicillium citrinum TaxID=5077 RepID=A0A9W9TNT4_PENCI|nr:uncharacterized protein N7469_005172 [Penicillium citrinum]KAJ5233406.1 hypothetical protein N7469_005172 [Penicillium citrinum]